MHRLAAITRIRFIVCRVKRWFTVSSSSILDPSVAQLRDSVSAADWETAFRAAHTLKGVAQNLGFDSLYRAAADLTEHLRGGKPLTEQPLMDAVLIEHERVMTAIEALG